MDIQLKPSDVAALVRMKIKDWESSHPGKEYPTSEKARICLIITVKEIWPKSMKRDLRLGILMALVGKPISTQKELLYHETKSLLDILRSPEYRKYIGPGCWEEIQVAVEGEYFGEPWAFPASRPG